jgi:hypothetical protein
MVLSWLNAKEAEQFGVSLAQFFIQRIPIEDPNKKNKSMAKKREVLDKMLLQITLFKMNHNLNIYKKAKLGNAFKWELRNAGYNAKFVDELTKVLATKL